MTNTTTAASAASAKTNYSAEQEAAIVSAAVEAGGKLTADGVAVLATAFGKSVKSVTAKVSRMGLYLAKERTRKDGSAVQKKDEFADAIGKILGLSEPDTESLTKANRKALETIFAALANSKPV